MRKLLPLMTMGCASVAAGAQEAAEAGPETKAQRPDIVLIMTDQQTALAMSCAGSKYVSTPNLDRLAARGVRFTNAYCTAPVSGPSRASMFTGMYPDEIGMIRNGAALPDSLTGRTLGSLVSAAGYQCAYGGKWHVGPQNTIPDGVYGFRRIWPHDDNGLGEACAEYLRGQHSGPFFLVASFDNPHNICEYAREQDLPWGKVEIPQRRRLWPRLPRNFRRKKSEPDVITYEQQSNYSAYPVVRWKRRDWRRYRAMYCALVEKVDAQIGKVIDAIDFDRTVVIFTSDHGDGVGAHHWNQKSALYEEVVNIPLIVCLPGGAHAGETRSQLVSNGVDIFASICDWAGAAAPGCQQDDSAADGQKHPAEACQRHPSGDDACPGCGARVPAGQGHSFRAAAEEDAPGQDFIVTETTFDKGTTRGWMLRTADYKYVLYDKGKSREQFFDMRSDRLEKHNLSAKKRCQGSLQAHRDLLDEWMSSHGVRPTRRTSRDIPGSSYK